MSDKEIFVFGSKIFHEEAKRDAISSLPLELSWKIFSYLDSFSLHRAVNTCKLWQRIIEAEKKLRIRLNRFSLVRKLGSKSLAKFYRRNKRKLKKEGKKRNFLEFGEVQVQTEVRVYNNKRGCEEMIIHTKRYKLF